MIMSIISCPTRARRKVVNWRAISRHGVTRVKLENEHVYTNSINFSSWRRFVNKQANNTNQWFIGFNNLLNQNHNENNCKNTTTVGPCKDPLAIALFGATIKFLHRLVLPSTWCCSRISDHLRRTKRSFLRHNCKTDV